MPSKKYTLTVIGRFSAAHFLEGYKGACEDLHGHNWKVELRVSTPRLDRIGLGVDFVELKAVLGRITGELDHKHLNALRIFSGSNPSSENIAEHIHGKARAALKSAKVKVESVTVWEGENACAAYSEE